MSTTVRAAESMVRRSAGWSSRAVCWSGWRARLAAAIGSAALLSCGRSPPSDHPGASTTPAEAAPGSAPSTPAAAPPAAAQPAAAATLRSGLARETFPDKQLVDVLLKVAAPLLASAEVDAAARSPLRELKKLQGVETVFSRATAGELRIVVRTTAAGRTAALSGALSTWQRHAGADFGPPEGAAIARGARARVAWAITDAATDGQITAAATDSQVAWAAALARSSRVHLAGAAAPAFHLDVLTRTAAENRLTLQEIVDHSCAALSALPKGLPLMDSAESEAELHQTLARVQLPRHRQGSEQLLAEVPATRVIALRRALAIAPRPALVGRNPVLLMLADGGVGVDLDGLMAQESAARRAPATRSKLTPAGQLLPQTVDAAQRFVLKLRPGERPESTEGMALRLLAVRDIPNIVSALAVRGWDGIPASLDSTSEEGQLWTVWLTPSGGKIDESLRAARDILDRGPWQATAIPANIDTALAWMLDQPAAAGLLVSSADATVVSAVTGAIGAAAQRSQSLENVAAGPVARPANGQFGRIDAEGARRQGLSARQIATAQTLLQGPLYCGEVRGAALWFGLPQGEMMAEQGRLPLAWPVAGQAGPPAAADLALLQRLPSQEPVLDRLRVDDKPSLFLLAQSSTGAAVEAILALRDAVDRQGKVSGVQLTSWTVGGTQQDMPSCVP